MEPRRVLVRELIEKLREVSQDLPVIIFNNVSTNPSECFKSEIVSIIENNGAVYVEVEND